MTRIDSLSVTPMPHHRPEPLCTDCPCQPGASWQFLGPEHPRPQSRHCEPGLQGLAGNNLTYWVFA